MRGLQCTISLFTAAAGLLIMAVARDARDALGSLHQPTEVATIVATIDAPRTHLGFRSVRYVRPQFFCGCDRHGDEPRCWCDWGHVPNAPRGENSTLRASYAATLTEAKQIMYGMIDEELHR